MIGLPINMIQDIDFFGVNWDKKMLNESEIIELLSDFKNNSINPKA